MIRYVAITTILAFGLTPSLALAQQKGGDKDPRGKADTKQEPRDGEKAITDVTDDIKIDKNPSKRSDGRSKENRGDPSSDRPTDSSKQVPPQTTSVAGQKAVNKDEDLDMAVGQTATTAAEPGRRDVIESSAEARREGEGRRVTAAPLVGYGFNDLGFGVGGRVGYTFDTPVYLGATFMYHAGKDGIVEAPGVVASSSSFMYPGIEAGYDIGIGPVLIRPYAGAGLLIGRISQTVGGNESTRTESAAMVYPGVNAHYIIGRTPIFVGGDTRLLLPFANQGPALTLLGTAGLHL
jgi:hypothetical protein